MVLNPVSSYPAAKSGKPRRPRRHRGWILSLSYAALLAAAVWKLDGAELPARSNAAPRAVLTTVVDWTRARFRPLVSGPGDHGASGALTSLQTQPEGWPSWTDAAATPPARQQR